LLFIASVRLARRPGLPARGAQLNTKTANGAIVSTREIRVDHTNGLNDGAICLNKPVRDVGRANF
jgi:hypothetical protein